MDKLKELMSRCKCGLFLTINEHRDYYQKAEDYLEEIQARQPESPLKIAADVRAKMIELNYIIDLQFYPDTPIGSYSIYHYDLDMALDEALACLKS